MTKELEIKKLFHIDFIDNTSIWVTISVVNGVSILDSICFGTLGEGINLIIKEEILDRIPKERVCPFISDYIKSSQYIKKAVDHFELEADELEKQLLKAY